LSVAEFRGVRGDLRGSAPTDGRLTVEVLGKIARLPFAVGG